jgi:hypothetical protein
LHCWTPKAPNNKIGVTLSHAQFYFKYKPDTFIKKIQAFYYASFSKRRRIAALRNIPSISSQVLQRRHPKMAAQTEPAVYHKTWTIDPEPEHIDFFLAALKTYREELIKEPTVLYFNAFRDQTKPGVFRFVFIYDADPMQVGEVCQYFDTFSGSMVRLYVEDIF